MAGLGSRTTPPPKFAVRISRGLVTHWQDGPLLTWEQANECRKALLDYAQEDGEVERVVAVIPVEQKK